MAITFGNFQQEEQPLQVPQLPELPQNGIESSDPLLRKKAIARDFNPQFYPSSHFKGSLGPAGNAIKGLSMAPFSFAFPVAGSLAASGAGAVEMANGAKDVYSQGNIDFPLQEDQGEGGDYYELNLADLLARGAGYGDQRNPDPNVNAKAISDYMPGIPWQGYPRLGSANIQAPASFSDRINKAGGQFELPSAGSTNVGGNLLSLANRLGTNELASLKQGPRGYGQVLPGRRTIQDIVRSIQENMLNFSNDQPLAMQRFSPEMYGNQPWADGG